MKRKNLFNLLFVPVLLITQLEISTIYTEVVGFSRESSLVKRGTSRSSFLSQANSLNQYQESLTSFNEIIDPKWAKLLQKAAQKEPAFQNPVEIRDLESQEVELFKRYIPKSDIVTIGRSGNYPIYADLTYGIPKINQFHYLYREYYRVSERRKLQDLRSEEVVWKELSASFVTIHPRTYSIFNKGKPTIYQKAYTNYAIEWFHPHYEVYQKRFNENFVEWKELWKSIAKDEIFAHRMESKFAKIPPFLTDYSIGIQFREHKTPNDFEYPVLYKVYLQQEKENKQIDKLTSEGVQVVLLKDRGNGDRDYKLPGFPIDPIQRDHRVFQKVHGIYKEQKTSALNDLSVEQLVEKVRIVPRFINRVTTLYIHGEETLEVDIDTPDFLRYFKAYLKSQRDRREKEKIEEIILHEIKELPQLIQGNKVFYDTYLNELIFSNHPHYKFYINAVRNQKQQEEINKRNCLRQLLYCEFTIYSKGMPGDSFVDRTKKKVIYFNDKQRSEYRKVWDQNKYDETHPDEVLYTEEDAELELIPQEIGLPILRKQDKEPAPGTLRWKIFRDAFLSERTAHRDVEEIQEREAIEELRKRNQMV